MVGVFEVGRQLGGDLAAPLVVNARGREVPMDKL
jgi:hypothetical protein